MTTMALRTSLLPLVNQTQERLHDFLSEARKRPSVPLLASLVLPGVGSMINGETRKGGVIFAGFLVSIALSVVLLGIIGMFGFWLWGLIDAYDGATHWDEHVH